MRIVLPGMAAAAAFAWLVAGLATGAVVWTPAFFLCLALLWLLWVRSGGRLWAQSPGTAVFLACLAFYLSTFRWHGGDDAPNSLIPFCLLRYKTLALDPVLDPWFKSPQKLLNFTLAYGSRRLSVYPVVPGILAAPLYAVPVLAGVVPSEAFLHNLSKLSGSLITAASVLVLHKAVSRRCSREWALCLAALYGLGSWAFSVSSQALWQHGPAQLGAALGLWGLVESGASWDFLAGFGFALAFAARPDSVFFAAAAGAYLVFHARRRLAGFLAGAAPPILFLAWYWLHYTGRLRPPEAQFQASFFSGFQWEAFFDLIFSPTRGLFFFFPAALFGIWAAFRFGGAMEKWLLAACAGPWILLSFYASWVGGNTFGPRYFAVAGLFLASFCASAEREIRGRPLLLAAWAGAVSACVAIHAVGAYFTWPGSQAIALEKAYLWSWSLHPIPNLASATGALGHLPLEARLLVVLAILAGSVWMASWMRGRLEAAR